MSLLLGKRSKSNIVQNGSISRHACFIASQYVLLRNNELENFLEQLQLSAVSLMDCECLQSDMCWQGNTFATSTAIVTNKDGPITNSCSALCENETRQGSTLFYGECLQSARS